MCSRIVCTFHADDAAAQRSSVQYQVELGVPVPGRGGAALALPLVRRTVIPRMLVDRQLFAALKQVREAVLHATGLVRPEDVNV